MAPPEPLTHALSVDVEDYFHVAALSGSISPRQWETLPSRVEQNTRRLMDLFEEHEVRATFFTLGWVARRFPELVREIASRGHEVASHGWSHTQVFRQTPEQFRTETRRSKELLEDITGAAVLGYRAASWSITEATPWALDILGEAGFVYDSSIFPIRHDLYGMPGSPRGIHRRKLSNGGEITEFPPTTARLLGLNLPAAGGGYFRLYPYWLSRALLRRVAEGEGRPCLFYTHPWEVDPDQPRIKAPWKSRFRHYNNLHKVQARLHCLLADFRFAALADVLSLGGPATDCQAEAYLEVPKQA